MARLKGIHRQFDPFPHRTAAKAAQATIAGPTSKQFEFDLAANEISKYNLGPIGYAERDDAFISSELGWRGLKPWACPPTHLASRALKWPVDVCKGDENVFFALSTPDISMRYYAHMSQLHALATFKSSNVMFWCTKTGKSVREANDVLPLSSKTREQWGALN